MNCLKKDLEGNFLGLAEVRNYTHSHGHYGKYTKRIYEVIFKRIVGRILKDYVDGIDNSNGIVGRIFFFSGR